MNELHKVSDEAHDSKTDCYCLANLKEFCPKCMSFTRAIPFRHEPTFFCWLRATCEELQSGDVLSANISATNSYNRHDFRHE